MSKNNSDEIIVKFDQVTKAYGDLVVLDKLNLDIKKNEMVSIIGPSGSGKTTVLRVLMTLEKINGSAITKILIAPYPRQREKDGLDIYPLYCLKCNYITEWAADPENISKNSINGVEYIKTFKINKKYKFYFQGIKDGLLSRGYTETEKTKANRHKAPSR